MRARSRGKLPVMEPLRSRAPVVLSLVGVLTACGPGTSPSMDASPDADVDAALEASSPADATDAPPTTTDARNCPAALGAPMPRTTPAPPAGPMDTVLRLNHLQALGTHNSYHLAPPNPIDDWNYTHLPIAQQLETQGVRKIELDVSWDARCGRLEVFHILNVDDRTTCRVFTDCLAAVRTWSDAHPAHHPIFIQIEPKDPVYEMDREARAEAIDREIRAVFPESLIITPDSVQGDAATLRDAVTTRGWPTLGAVRGKVLFFIDRSDGFRDVYTHGGRDLRGRAAFIDSDATHPYAAVQILNGPVRDAMEISTAVRAGYLVRTMSDPSFDLIRMNDRTTADAALASGAHIVSTDHPAPVMGIEFAVTIPGGTPSRCNPLVAPMGCTSAAIEALP